jgi:hypothetical protein
MEWLLAHPEGEDDEEDDDDDEVMDQGSLMLFKSTFCTTSQLSSYI